MTREEAKALRAKIRAAAEHIPDEAAPDVAWMFPAWRAGKEYTVGERVQDGDALYKCRQPHTSQDDWRPAVAPSLWEVVADPHQSGTHDNPIAFVIGMAVENGLFYSEDGVLYECIRDSVNPLYNRLADLIGIYVQVAN